jgi:predicted small metal-binding protein
MMYLKCRRLNGKRCHFVAKGRNKWDVEFAMFDHEAKAHKELLVNATNHDRRRMIESMDRLIKKK